MRLHTKWAPREAVIVVSPVGRGVPAGAGQEREATPAKMTLPIIGLSLGGCGALTLEHAIQRLTGVQDVYVNPATETAYVTFDPARIGEDALRRTIRELGYETREGWTL